MKNFINKHPLKAIILVIFLVLILNGCAKKEVKNESLKTATEPNFKYYNNPTEGIKIKYPSDWVQEDLLGGFSFFFHPLGNLNGYQAEGLTITPGIISEDVTLEMYTNSYIKELKNSDPNVKIIESAKSKLAGNAAYKLVFTTKDGEFNVKTMAIWTIKNNKPYLTTFSAESDRYQSLLATAQQMIESFEITY